jgi:hypothetical protein
MKPFLKKLIIGIFVTYLIGGLLTLHIVDYGLISKYGFWDWLWNSGSATERSLIVSFWPYYLYIALK